MRNKVISTKRPGSGKTALRDRFSVLSIVILVVFIFPWGVPFAARAEETKINVVTTLSVLKDFVEQIGQNRVSVSSLLTGMESEHTYTPKPSDILAIKKAQILVQIGLGLEVWVHTPERVSSGPGTTLSR